MQVVVGNHTGHLLCCLFLSVCSIYVLSMDSTMFQEHHLDLGVVSPSIIARFARPGGRLRGRGFGFLDHR